MVHIVHSREELEHLLVSMHTDGSSIRSLSRHFAMSRNSVRQILRAHQKRRDEGHDLLADNRQGGTPRKTKLDPFLPRITGLLTEFPNITGQRVYEELKSSGYAGGITILRDRLQKLRSRPKQQPVVRFETEPGVQGQMDWSPYTIPFVRGGKIKVQCFSYILGFSRRQFVDFSLRRDFFTLIRRHQDAFQHFGGVPKECLYDSEKTVVLRWEAGHPIFNPAFVAFITHYQCRPRICARGRAQTKGKIERPFQYVEGNLLNGRKFQDIDDLRAFAKWWLAEKSDVHDHETTGRPPLALFMEQELSALKSLPRNPYDSAEVALRVARIDGFLELETNLYSIPYEFVADILTMKATEREIFVYSPGFELIAVHERLPAGAGLKTEKLEHRAAKQVRYGLEPVQDSFLTLGGAAESFLAGLKEKQPRNCGFHARYILQLKKDYHSRDIDKALAHASRYQAFDGKAIERILKAKSQPRTLESIRNEQALAELKKTMPEIKQRPLRQYSELFLDNDQRNYRPPDLDQTLPEDPEAFPDGKGPE